MQRIILPLLMSMVVLSPMAIDIFLASVPDMALELNASTSEIQSTISIFFFAMGLGQIFVGPVADRYGRRGVALAGLLAYVLTSWLIALIDNILMMQLLRLAQGLAACAISVVIFSVVRDSYSYAKSSKIYSYLNGVLSIVPACAPIVGTLIAEYFGWRATFVFMAVYGLVVLLLVARYLPETLSEDNKSLKSKGRLFNSADYIDVFGDGYFLFCATCCMAGMAAILTYVSYAPVWLIGHLSVSMTLFSLLFGFNAMVSIVSSFLAPVLIQRYGNRKVVVLALSLIACCALLLLALNSLFSLSSYASAFAFMLPIMFLSAGLSLVLGPATTMALSRFSTKAATASAVLGFLQMVGASVVVFIVQQLSLPAPVAIVLVIALFCVPLLTFMNIKKYSKWHCEKL